MDTFEIIIDNFRCHGHRKITVREKQLLLIRQPSGSGKSTIFEAISFCLYDKPHLPVNQVNNLHVLVSLSFSFNSGKVHICRELNPTRLTYQFQSNNGSFVYNDHLAQTEIQRNFGPYDVWRCSSYIRQKDCNHFLSLLDKDKKSILDYLSFQEDSFHYSGFVNKINEAKKSARDNEVFYRRRLEEETARLSWQYGQPASFEISSDAVVVEIQREGFELSQQLSIMKPIQQERDWKRRDIERECESLKVKLANQQSSLNHVLSQIGISDIPKRAKKLCEVFDIKPQDCTTEIILSMREIGDRLVEMNNLLSRRTSRRALYDKLSSELARYATILKEDDKSVHQDDLTRTLQQEERRRCQISKLDRLKREYSSLSDNILEIQYPNRDLHVEYWEKIIRLNRIVKLDDCKSKIAIVPDFIPGEVIPKPSNRDKELVDLKATLKSLNLRQHATKLLECPSCHDSLRMHEGQLIKMDKHDNIEELNIQNEIQRVEAMISGYKEEVRSSQRDYDLKIETERKRLKQWESNKKCIETSNNNLIMMIVKLEAEISKSDEENLTELESEISNLAEMISKLETGISSLVKSNNENLVKSDSEILRAENFLTKLRQIDIIPMPELSSQIMGEIITSRQLKSQVDTLESELKELNQKLTEIDLIIRSSRLNSPDSITGEEVIQSVNDLVSYQLGMKNLFDQEKNLRLVVDRSSSQLESLNSQLNDLKSQDQTLLIVELEKRSQELHYQWQKHQQNIFIRDEYLRLDQLRGNYMTACNRHLKLEKMIEIAQRVQSVTFQSLLDQLNDSIAPVCEKLFPHAIDVRLNSVRELKDGREKNQISVTFEYQGRRFDRIQDFSGGEADRISLALLIAFQTVHPTPFLLLDESLSALDPNSKEDCIDVLQDAMRSLGDRTVFIIMHEGTEGWFDDVII